LTTEGRQLFDRVTPAHVSTENRLLAALSPEQQAELVVLLRQLLISFEGSVDDGALPRLGLALAPAHGTIEMRRAVGLPEVVGLLVRQVEEGSRAERAGLKTGDVLVRAAGRELRSVTALYGAFHDTQTTGQAAVSGVRGVNTKFRVMLDLRPGPPDDGPSFAELSVTYPAGTHSV
jgi:S1-C subfamily serine protease